MPRQPKPEDDIPRFARECWDRYQSATTEVRQNSVESLKMWMGGKWQWLETEIASRRASNRPFLSLPWLKAISDQVINEARQNPPGPEAHPVGGGSDKDGADILEGLIREYEYRSDAQRAYIHALFYAANGNYGVFELATEYDGERSLQQRLKVVAGEDPSMYFCDPAAKKPCREDAMFGGKIRVLSRDQVIADYGPNLKILKRGYIERAAGWMQDTLGWSGNQSTVNMWTGGVGGEGPYYVCEFYRVVNKRVTLTLYSDGILRFEDEYRPAGVHPEEDEDGNPMERDVTRRSVMKHVVTALDEVSEPIEWPGDIIPLFWVLGPEVWVDGKLHRLSLIDPAKDAQRALNYSATSAVETMGFMSKAPWIGPQGAFDVQNAQGVNPWEVSSVVGTAYLEYKPVFATDPSTGMTAPLPPPQRNAVEAPIARFMEAANFFVGMIKGIVSVFFDPNIQSVADAESGEAIKALQAQTNIGTLNWQDALHRAVGLSYNQAAKILPQILDGPRVQTIVRADGQHEIAEINREFPPGKKGRKNDITLGEYSLRVTCGPSFRTRQEQSIEALTEVFRIVPQILSSPGVAAQFLRMVGEGSPQVEQIADALLGVAQGSDATPEQLKSQIATLQQSDQQKTMLLQKLGMAMQAKLPDMELRKWEAAIKALTSIRVAEINASKDSDKANADRAAQIFESITGMAHETAQQAVDHGHAIQQAQLAGQQQQQQEEQQQQEQEQPTA